MTIVNAQQELLVPSQNYKKYDSELIKALIPEGFNQFWLLKKPSMFMYQDVSLVFQYQTMKLTLRKTRSPKENEPSIVIDKYELKLNKEQADAIYSLFTAAVYSSSLLADASILDGETYTFGAYPDAAEIIPYYKGSNGYHLTEIADMLCECVQTNNLERINDNLKDIKDLTDKFVERYPCKPSEDSAIRFHHGTYQVKGKSMGLDF
jgi:hypothetical protein